MELQRLNKPEGSFALTWDKSVLKLSDQVPITIHYEKTSNPTMMNYYKRIYRTAEYLDMTGCITSENNHNLTHLENLLLQWNFKLWNNGFSKASGLEGKVGWASWDRIWDETNSRSPSVQLASMGSRKEIKIWNKAN